MHCDLSSLPLASRLKLKAAASCHEMSSMSGTSLASMLGRPPGCAGNTETRAAY